MIETTFQAHWLTQASRPETISSPVMPILRQPTHQQQGPNQGFQTSVSSVPMAMSMMVDSMVNMVQNSRPELKSDSSNSSK